MFIRRTFLAAAPALAAPTGRAAGHRRDGMMAP